MKKVAVLDIRQFHDHDSTEDFYANTLENHLITRHKDISVPHSHNFYLAILFTQGSGIHEVDFTTYDVQPGALFFLNPGQTHHWELSTDTKGFIFFHSKTFYELHYTQNRLAHFPFFYSIHNSPSLYIKGNPLTEITVLFETIYIENSAHSSIFKKQKLISLADLVYIEGTRLYAEQNPLKGDNQNSYYTKFRKLEELVEKHFKTEKSPSAYASMLAMTPKHLNRITQAVVGKTLGDVILDRILLEAKKELVLQQGGFAEIAYTLGYDDYAYFSRLFKKKTGETPTQFLARYSKK